MPTTPVHQGRPGRIWAALLTLAMTCGMLPGAAAVLPATSLQVLLDSVSPSVAAPGQPVSITGSVVNNGAAPVRLEQVRARAAYRSLDTHALVTGWFEDAEQMATPHALGSDRVAGDLLPGAAVQFSIQVAPEDLTPDLDLAMLPLVVEAVSTDFQVGGSVRASLGWDRRTSGAPAIDVGLLVPVTLPPDPRLASTDQQVRDRAWKRAIGRGSQVAELLDGLAATTATYLVDPAVLAPPDPVATLAPEPSQPPAPPEPTSPVTVSPTPDSPTTDSPTPGAPKTGSPTPGAPTTGSPTPGAPTPGSPTTEDVAPSPFAPPVPPPGLPAEPTPPPADEGLAEQLGYRLATLPPGRVWALPTGDVDTHALHQLGVPPDQAAGLVGRQPAAGSEGLPGEHRSDVAWPVVESVDDVELLQLGSLWQRAGLGSLQAVVLPASLVQADAHPTPPAVWRARSGPMLLTYHEGLSALIVDAGAPEADGVAVQRLLAETLAIYQERPAVQRSLVLALPRGARVDSVTLSDVSRALEEAPWLRPVTGDQLLQDAAAMGQDLPLATLTGTPAPEDEATAYPPPGASPLTMARIERIATTRDQLAGVAEVVPDGMAGAATWTPVLDSLFSARWREKGSAWPKPLDAVDDVVATVVDGVRINPTSINFLADEGQIQITVINDLPVQVSGLKMSVQPSNGRLRVIEAPGPISIGPGSRATVTFRAQALAAGQVELVVRLASPNGTRIGPVEPVEVNTQPIGGWIYWLVGGAAALVLVLGLVRALRPARPTAIRVEVTHRNGTT